MKKVELIYYNILNFQKENLELLKNEFDVSILEDPNHDRRDLLERAKVVFALRLYSTLSAAKIQTIQRMAANFVGIGFVFLRLGLFDKY